MTCFGINSITSANASREQSKTLSTTIYVGAPHMESNATFATSYIPTINVLVTQAADFQEIKTTYPVQLLDLLGTGVTRGHIGLPLAFGEIVGMARLGAVGGGLID